MNRREFLATSTAALVATTIPINISASSIKEMPVNIPSGENITIRGSTTHAWIAIEGLTHEDIVVRENVKLGDPTKYKYKHLISVGICNQTRETHNFEIYEGENMQACYFVGGSETTYIKMLY